MLRLGRRGVRIAARSLDPSDTGSAAMVVIAAIAEKLRARLVGEEGEDYPLS